MAPSSRKRRGGARAERAAEAAPAPASERASGIVLSDRAAENEAGAILLLAEELGKLAADLWFAGKLDGLPAEDESRNDAEDD